MNIKLDIVPTTKTIECKALRCAFSTLRCTSKILGIIFIEEI